MAIWGKKPWPLVRLRLFLAVELLRKFSELFTNMGMGQRGNCNPEYTRFYIQLYQVFTSYTI